MNEEDRQKLAQRLIAVRNDRFKGSKKAAYTAAGVNAATWDRAESGLTIKDHSRAAIVSALWPESGGDWTRIPETDLTTWADLSNPRYDNKHMARRIDELEQRLETIEALLNQGYRPLESVPRATKPVEDMTPDEVAEARRIGKLARRAAEDMDLNDVQIAARRGTSRGQQLRREQDAAGEENQDDGGEA